MKKKLILILTVQGFREFLIPIVYFSNYPSLLNSRCYYAGLMEVVSK